eukprot:5556834-Pleurochrysis_carterae.AAC.1
MKLADYAKADDYKRYNTGEPHPLDGDGAFLVSYVDPETGWQMYRYDANAVQPENGNKAYFDCDAAAEQRERWRLEELEAAEYERNQERYADEMFLEPLPTHPDNCSSVSEPFFDSCDSFNDSDSADCPKEQAQSTPPAGSSVTLPIVIDEADTATAADGHTQQGAPSPMEVDPDDRAPAAASASMQSGDVGLVSPPMGGVPDVRSTPATTAPVQRIDSHRSTWSIVSLMANVVMVTTAVTAGIMHAMPTSHGGPYQALALATS